MDHWLDYVIFASFMAISLSIGVYHACTGGKQTTPEEFIMNDRKLQASTERVHEGGGDSQSHRFLLGIFDKNRI